MTTLEEEDKDAVLLYAPVAALKLEVAVSPTMGDVWSVSPVMMAWELVQCSE
jgi:hypothetical protein